MEMLPKDILFEILSGIDKNLTYPLLFVSKKFNNYVKDKKILCDKKYFIDYVVKSGLFDLLKWTVKNGCKLNSNICSYATCFGHFEILKWAKESGCQFNSNTCAYAAYFGHFEIAKWIKENGCPE